MQVERVVDCHCRQIVAANVAVETNPARERLGLRLKTGFLAERRQQSVIRIFTCLDKETIDALIAAHDEAPHMRALQKRLAEEVTVMVHSREDYEAAVEASNILFGNATHEALSKLDEEMFLQVFDGVEKYEISREDIEAGIPPLDLLAEKTKIFPSKGEARKMIIANGFSINKEKFTDPQKTITADMLLNGKYLLCQKGKKNYYIVEVKG